MSEALKIRYTYVFGNQAAREFDVFLDTDSLELISQRRRDLPPWTRLTHRQCGICTLEEQSNEYCPIALNLAHIVEEFKESFSYENVTVSVTTRERTYEKATTLQEGLSSLIGIIMVTSGCPVMERLKPMVRFHLPFATIEETVFRTVSTYLVAQYFLKRKGRDADWELKGLTDIYSNVRELNMDFAERLKDAAKKDANINALVGLDCFAVMVPMTAEEMLKGIENYFSAYLD